MADRHYWFAPKRYGYGAGLPIAWQGWALLGGFLAVAVATVAAFGERPVMVWAILAPLTLTMMIIAARKTRGGWRWRWGEKE